MSLISWDDYDGDVVEATDASPSLDELTKQSPVTEQTPAVAASQSQPAAQAAAVAPATCGPVLRVADRDDDGLPAAPRPVALRPPRVTAFFQFTRVS